MRIGVNAHLLSFEGNYRQAGLSRYIDELLFRLPRVMPKADFTAFTGHSPLPPSVQASLPANLTISRSQAPTERAPVRIAWEQTALPLAATLHRLDLLHCPVNVLPILCPCPAVITVHDLIFLHQPGAHHPAKRFYLSAMTGWSARHAAQVIAVSEATRQDVIKLLHVNPKRVTTVHNGVGEEFKPLPPGEQARFRKEKGVEGRVVLYVGTLEPRKNLPLLLRAFRLMIDEPGYSDVTLYIGGSKGWYYDEIFGTARQLGLEAEGRVRFLGRVAEEELPLWYNISSLFAYPSIYEGFGLPALEAMSCGTPVLAANRSALPEVMGDVGLLLDPTDEAAWVEGMKRLLGPEREEMAKRALVQARRFSWQKAAVETANVYGKVLARQARRRTDKA